MLKYFVMAVALLGLVACKVEVTHIRSLENIIAETAVTVELNPGLCAGSVISEDEVLTANHCVANKSKTDYVYVTISGKKYLARVERTDEVKDLALLIVPGLKFQHPLQLAPHNVRLGDDVWMIGHPRALFYNMVTKGIVGQLNYVQKDTKGKWTVLDISSTFGNSGGMVINSDGELVGVTSKIVLFGQTQFDPGEFAGQYGLIVRWEDIKEFLSEPAKK